MKKTRKPANAVSADTIARLADQGKDVSRFLKGQGRMVRQASRQAVIKTLVRQALDQHYLAQRARRPQ